MCWSHDVLCPAGWSKLNTNFLLQGFFLRWGGGEGEVVFA